jgi:phosphoribosylanthranilate isomerase
VRIRVKICGITRPEWAVAAAEAGADAIGLVFAESPRRVSVADAARIVAALPPWVAPVGVFVDESAERIRAIAAEVGLGAIQLHGDEPPELPAVLAPLKVIKAFRIGSPADLDAADAWQVAAEKAGRRPDAWLIDAAVPGGPKGGTGQRGDWTLAAQLARTSRRPPQILAGGLTPENVAEAIKTVRPWGVDASGGLEDSPGVKSPEKIRAFVEAVRKTST